MASEIYCCCNFLKVVRQIWCSMSIRSIFVRSRQGNAEVYWKIDCFGSNGMVDLKPMRAKGACISVGLFTHCVILEQFMIDDLPNQSESLSVVWSVTISPQYQVPVSLADQPCVAHSVSIVTHAFCILPYIRLQCGGKGESFETQTAIWTILILYHTIPYHTIPYVLDEGQYLA